MIRLLFAGYLLKSLIQQVRKQHKLKLYNKLLKSLESCYFRIEFQAVPSGRTSDLATIN